jgi:hypothetical protein
VPFLQNAIGQVFADISASRLSQQVLSKKRRAQTMAPASNSLPPFLSRIEQCLFCPFT